MHLLSFGSLFCEGYGDPRDLHVLTHSSPTRRSSDLADRPDAGTKSEDILAVEQHLTAGDAHAAAPVGKGSEADGRLAGTRLADKSEHPALLQGERSEEHTSELQSLMRISYAVFCLQIKKNKKSTCQNTSTQCE